MGEKRGTRLNFSLLSGQLTPSNNFISYIVSPFDFSFYCS